jgi:hypothetical protein
VVAVRPTVRDHALPARFAVVAGVTLALLVVSQILLALGHGVAAWALLLLTGVVSAGSHLAWRRRVDGGPVGTTAGGVALVVAQVALCGGASVLARSLAADALALAVAVAALAGALGTALLRWWQLRPVAPDPVVGRAAREQHGAAHRGGAPADDPGRNGTKRQNSTVA